MDVFLSKISQASRGVLENLFTYYVYDLSEFMKWDPNFRGEYTFNTASLDPYFVDSQYVPYFIQVDSKLAGFVLVRPYPTNPRTLDVEQFFVLRKYKGQGVGKLAVQELLARHRGNWQIRIMKENTAGLKFWASAISSVVGSSYQVAEELDIDLEMVFLRFDV